MQYSQKNIKVSETARKPLTGARRIGVKTKNGCEDPLLGQIPPPGGRSYVLIFGKLIGFERQYFATPPGQGRCLQVDWMPLTRADARANGQEPRRDSRHKSRERG